VRRDLAAASGDGNVMLRVAPTPAGMAYVRSNGVHMGWAVDQMEVAEEERVRCCTSDCTLCTLRKRKKRPNGKEASKRLYASPCAMCGVVCAGLRVGVCTLTTM
jgi:hypothetical protein